VAGQSRLQESLSLAQLMRQAFRASATCHEAFPSDFAFAEAPAKQTQTSMADSAYFMSQHLAKSNPVNRQLRPFDDHAHQFQLSTASLVARQNYRISSSQSTDADCLIKQDLAEINKTWLESSRSTDQSGQI
jgi:hypothetical protein